MPPPEDSDEEAAAARRAREGKAGFGTSGDSSALVGLVVGLVLAVITGVAAITWYTRRAWRRRRFFESSRAMLSPSAWGRGTRGTSLLPTSRDGGGDGLLLPSVAYSGGGIADGRGPSQSVANPLRVVAVELNPLRK